MRQATTHRINRKNNQQPEIAHTPLRVEREMVGGFSGGLMKRIFSFILIFVAVFAVASCGDKKKKDDVKEKVSKEIAADKGGTVSTSDESVAVDIPADALDSNTTITVSVYESSHYSTAKGEKVIG